MKNNHRKYENLTLVCITPSQHAMTCNYWYLVQINHTAHRAFETSEGLCLWLNERGLKLSKDIPKEKGIHQCQNIIGAYIENCLMCEPDEWDNVGPIVDTVRELSNGQYTRGKITLDPDGVKIVNYLNPNIKYRMIYNYSASQEMLNRGEKD